MASVFLLQADLCAADRLRQTIETVPGMKVAHVASTLADARLALSAITFDVVVTDLWLRDAASPALMQTLAAALRHGRTRVLAIAMSGDDPRLLEALRCGADGYFAMSRFATTLPEAIEQVLRGESTMSSQIAREVKRYFDAHAFETTDFVSETQNPLCLSDNERMLLQWIGEGYLPSEVARGLQLSARTVGLGIRNIYRKLQFHRQADTLSLAA